MSETSILLPDGFEPSRRRFLSNTGKATLSAAGNMALATLALVSGDLADGRLVKPFDLKLQTEFAYYVVYPPDALAQVKVRAFRDFLLAEAAEESEQTSV